MRDTHGGRSQHDVSEPDSSTARDVQQVMLPASDGWPNNARLPVLIYRGALAEARSGEPPAALDGTEVCRRLRQNGWRGIWENGVFSYHHFHSNAHEVLVVCEGEATLQLGGPQGRSLQVHTGDVIILPAGTAHKNAGASPGFRVVGAYPAGQEDFDLLRGATPSDEAAIRQRIEAVPLPQTDPVYGPQGPLLELWSVAS